MSHKGNKEPQTNKPDKAKEWPLIIFVWIGGIAVLSYVIVEMGWRDSLPHPIHWVVGMVGGLLGLLVGWVWYRVRGDIDLF